MRALVLIAAIWCSGVGAALLYRRDYAGLAWVAFSVVLAALT